MQCFKKVKLTFLADFLEVLTLKTSKGPLGTFLPQHDFQWVIKGPCREGNWFGPH